MVTIWDEDFEPAAWRGAPSRLSAKPEVVASLIAALGDEVGMAGRLAELRLEARPEHTQSLFLTGTDSATGMGLFVKLNITPWELYWMRALGEHAPDLVPRVLASGERLGRDELRWLVLERAPYQLLNPTWGERVYDLLAEAAVSFHIAAQSIDRRFTGMECLDATQRWIELALREGCPGPLTRVLQRLEEDWDWVARTCGLEVCFGDLTPVNALSRTPPPGGGPALLIDPIPRVAPWAWDAAYCQTISANSDVRMVQRMAQIRRRRGLYAPEGPELDRLAVIMLAWLSACWWGIAPWRHNDLPWRAQIERYVEASAVR